MRSRWLPYGIILAASALLTWPGVLYGIAKGHDIINHVIWQTQFSKQFWMGDIYPRWLTDVHMGLGSPAFFFYGPLPFFFGSALYPIFNSWLNPVQQVSLCAAISVFLSGIGTYCWLNGSLSKRNALLGALIYIAIPYHLYVNYYVRFAYGELWAMAMVPFLLWFADRIIKNKSFAAAGFSLFYAFLIMSHLPTTLLVSPLLIFYFLFLAKRGDKIKALVKLAACMTLGIGLSAVYFIPAMYLQQTVHLPLMNVGKYEFDKNFIFNAKNNHPDFRHHLFFMTIWSAHGFLLFTIAIVLCLTQKRDKSRRNVLFWGIVGFTSFFMMLPASRMMWDLVPVLKKVQFPWRFHTIFSLSLLFILVQGLRRVGRKWLWSGWRPRVAAPALIAVLLLPFILNASFHPKNPFPNSVGEMEYWRIQRIKSLKGASEYVPKSSSIKLLTTKTIEMPPIDFISGQGSVNISSWSPRNIVLDVQADSHLELQIKQYYYPGWEAHQQDKINDLKTYPTLKNGLLGVSIPKGRSRISINLAMNPAEKFGWMVSGVALLIWLVITGTKASVFTLMLQANETKLK